MSADTNTDNVVELSQSKTISEASPSLHRHDNAIIRRDIIQDPGIPIDARMLLVYLVSFRPGWTFYDCKIRTDLGIGFTKLKLLFKQLRELGYVKTVPIIGDKGRMIGSKRMFSDFPEFQKTNTEAANSTESMVSRQSVAPTARKNETKIPNSNIKLDLNNNKIKKYKKDFEKEFDEFWEQYPNKVDKHNAYEKYKKLLTTDYGLHAVILSALCIQNQQREIKAELGIWQAEPKGPAAWLNAKRWDDQDIKTREQLESESSKNKRTGNGQYQQSGHGSDFGRPQSKIEARNNLVRRILDEDVANARRVFERGFSSEGGGQTEY